MWAEFITLAAIAAIQHSVGVREIVVMMAVAIILGLLLAGGFVGIVIAAFTPNASVLKGAFVGIGVTVCGSIVGVIAIPVAPHPLPVAMWVLFWVGLVTAAVCIAVVIIRRIGRSANQDV